MANEEAKESPAEEEKTRRTVPPIAIGSDGRATAKGISEHARDLREAQWDKEQKAFRDPITCMQALFAYARLTASRVAEAEEKIAAQEARLAAFEIWRDDSTRQAKEMFEAIEKEIAAQPELARLVKVPPQLASVPADAVADGIKVMEGLMPSKTTVTGPKKKKGDDIPVEVKK